MSIHERQESQQGEEKRSQAQGFLLKKPEMEYSNLRLALSFLMEFLCRSLYEHPKGFHAQMRRRRRQYLLGTNPITKEPFLYVPLAWRHEGQYSVHGQGH
jgi:hypothetical protein